MCRGSAGNMKAERKTKEFFESDKESGEPHAEMLHLVLILQLISAVSLTFIKFIITCKKKKKTSHFSCFILFK